MKENRPWFIRFSKHVELAMIYADDDATRTAARLLREAIGVLDEEIKRRDELIQKSSVKGTPPAE